MNGAATMTEEKAPSAPPVAAAPAAGEPEAPAAKSENRAPPIPPEAGEPSSPEWESRFKYLLADFENYRRRAERDRESVRRRAEADVLRNLLPIQDSFERAQEFVRTAPPSDPIRKGMELLAREWDGFLAREGIQPVARVGNRFDAEEHEVVGESAPTPGQSAGTVIEVIQQGYRFRGGLLRPAKVLIARPAAASGASAASPPLDAPGEEPSE